MTSVVVVSDLHLEFSGVNTDSWPNADILALCGDIGVGLSALPFIERLIASGKYGTIVYVCGNHEFYNSTVESVEEDIREFEKCHPTFTFLDSETYLINWDLGVVITGGTLWTDLSNIEDAVVAQYYMNDYRVITTTSDPDVDRAVVLKPYHTTAWHKKTVKQIEKGIEVAKSHGMKALVFTHHAPNAICQNKKYSGSNLAPAYFTDLSHLFKDVALWGCGHTHNRVDTVIDGMRLVQNCRGYESSRWTEIQEAFIPTVIHI